RYRVRVRDVVLGACVERCHVLGFTADDRTDQTLDPLGSDAPQVAVDDRTRARSEQAHRLEDRAERRTLPRAPLVPTGDGGHAIGGRAHPIGRAVLGTAVRIDDRDARVAEVAAPRPRWDGRDAFVW